jgi:zinc transporter ZupT
MPFKNVFIKQGNQMLPKLLILYYGHKTHFIKFEIQFLFFNAGVMNVSPLVGAATQESNVWVLSVKGRKKEK